MKYNSREKLKKIWSERLMSKEEREMFHKKEREGVEMTKRWKKGLGTGKVKVFDHSSQQAPARRM